MQCGLEFPISASYHTLVRIVLRREWRQPADLTQPGTNSRCFKLSSTAYVITDHPDDTIPRSDLFGQGFYTLVLESNSYARRVPPPSCDSPVRVVCEDGIRSTHSHSKAEGSS